MGAALADLNVTVRGDSKPRNRAAKENIFSSEASMMSSSLELVEVGDDELCIHEKVGSGTTSEVFRATLHGHTIVAVKVIDWVRSSLPTREARAFDREVVVMASVDHPNLVKLLGVVSISRPFKVLSEFCAGGSCFQLLHNRKRFEISKSQNIKMLNDTALGVLYLHRHEPQIIHRDLKSLNLLLTIPVTSKTDIPLVKITDFGLSRMKETACDVTWGKMTRGAGTNHWMAPEVFLGSCYDEKVDVYSFGMICYEFICREIPFDDEECATIGSLVVAGIRPDLDAVPAAYGQLQALMTACWAQDAIDRPSLDEVIVALRNASPPEEARRTKKRSITVGGVLTENGRQVAH